MKTYFIGLGIFLAILTMVWLHGYNKATRDHEIALHEADSKNEIKSDKIFSDVASLSKYDRCIELGGLRDSCRKLLGVANPTVP